MVWNKSPLRYPGGKSKALRYIIPRIPTDIREYREPFVGGGSVALNVDAPNKWINDLNYGLYCFWDILRDNKIELIETVQWYKHTYSNGKELFNITQKPIGYRGLIDAAARYFISNRIRWGGGGAYSQSAFETRFNQSHIDRLHDVDLTDVRITPLDYDYLLKEPGQDVFIFLDPPYLSAWKSKLYIGHETFDHQRLSDKLKVCQHNWLMTYDDSPEIRALYSWAHIEEWTQQYSMSKKKGKELFICPNAS